LQKTSILFSIFLFKSFIHIFRSAEKMLDADFGDDHSWAPLKGFHRFPKKKILKFSSIFGIFYFRLFQKLSDFSKHFFRKFSDIFGIFAKNYPNFSKYFRNFKSYHNFSKIIGIFQSIFRI
jgi:hypothetical protein